MMHIVSTNASLLHAFENVPQNFDEPAFFTHSLSISLVEILDEHFVGNFEVETGDLKDPLYYSDVNEMVCIHLNGNKIISNARQERSAATRQ